MTRYQVIVKWMEIHEIEVEAESEEEAENLGIQYSTEESACDSCLYDVNVIELEDEEQ